MQKAFYGIKDVTSILGVSESKGYEYIRTMNAELKEKGFLIVRGKVTVVYFNERFLGVAAEKQ